MNSYKIETVQDIADCVTLENLENFITDFRGVLASYLLLKSVDKNVKLPKFTWIDDGEHSINITFGKK